MSDYTETKVVDNYKDHPQHFTYNEKCSECYKNIREFDGLDSEEDLKDLEEEIKDMFEISLQEDDYNYNKDDVDYHEAKDEGTL